jgi:hypothetical protein
MPKRIILDLDRVGPWVSSRTGGTYSPTDVGIGLEKDGVLVAGTLFDSYLGNSMCVHLAGDGKDWLNREFLHVCFDYPFNQAKIKKLIGLVDSTNTQARKFDEHIGFVLEATIKDAGRHGDLLIYSMTRQQCRYLKE